MAATVPAASVSPRGSEGRLLSFPIEVSLSLSAIRARNSHARGGAIHSMTIWQVVLVTPTSKKQVRYVRSPLFLNRTNSSSRHSSRKYGDVTYCSLCYIAPRNERFLLLQILSALPASTPPTLSSPPHSGTGGPSQQ